MSIAPEHGAAPDADNVEGHSTTHENHSQSNAPQPFADEIARSFEGDGLEPGDRIAVGYQPAGGHFDFKVLTADEAPAFVRTLGPDCHVWANNNPLRLGPLARRGGVGDVVALRTLTADLDFKRLRFDNESDEVARERAERIVEATSQALGVAPTKVTDTGGGLHPRWLLDPEDHDARFEPGSAESNRATSALKRFGNLVGIIAREVWPDAAVDNVFDLAHIFRVAGTRNVKAEYGSPRLVTATYPGGAALSLDSLEEALDARGIPQEQATTRKAREAHGGPVYEDMPSGARRRVDLFVDKVFDRLKDELEEGARLSPTGTDAKGRTWQRIVADAGFDGGEFAASWTGLAEGDVLRRLEAIVPEEMKGANFSGGRTVSQTLNNHVGRKDKAAPPEWLAGAIAEAERGLGTKKLASGAAYAAERGPALPTDWADKVASERLSSRASTSTTTTSASGDGGQPTQKGKGGPSHAEIVVETARAGWRVEITPDGQPFAVPLTGPRLAIDLGAKGGALRALIAKKVYDERGIVLGAEALGNGLAVFMADAYERMTPIALHLRVAESDGRVVLDLGQPGTMRCVVITADGWTVEDEPPKGVYFRRPRSLAALPTPVREGSLEPLRRLLAFEADDRRWHLTRGWLAVCLRAEIPRPLLLAVGAPGTGKSTRGRLIVNVIDPRPELGSSFGRNLDDDQVKAMSRYLLGYDNLTSISEAVSDHVCRLVTGDNVEKRKNYTDTDSIVLAYRRTGVITAVTMPALRADALERVIPLHLDTMKGARRSEAALRAEFDAAHPGILGAVLDDAVAMLRHLPTTAPRTDGPRMLDYWASLLAIDPALADAFAESADDILVDAAEDDPLVVMVREWLRAYPRNEREGEPADEFASLDHFARVHGPPDYWPKNQRAMSTALTKASNTLSAVGVTFARGKANGRRSWRFVLDEEQGR